MSSKEVVQFLRDVAKEVEGFIDEEWAGNAYNLATTIEEVLEEQNVSLDEPFFSPQE